MESKGCCIIIVGPSQSGKNTIADKLIPRIDIEVALKSNNDSIRNNANSIIIDGKKILLHEKNMPAFYATKYTTRAIRVGEIGLKCMSIEEFPPEVDIRAVIQDGNIIGYSSMEILSSINNGRYPVICTTSLELMKDINEKLGDKKFVKNYAINAYSTSIELMKEMQKKRVKRAFSTNEENAVEARFIDTQKYYEYLSKNFNDFDGVLDYFNYYGILVRGVEPPSKFCRAIKEMCSWLADGIVNNKNYDRLWSKMYEDNKTLLNEYLK